MRVKNELRSHLKCQLSELLKQMVSFCLKFSYICHLEVSFCTVINNYSLILFVLDDYLNGKVLE